MKAEVLHANPDFSPFGRSRIGFVETLRSQGKTVALIEGCTGGAISDAITVPGASKIISGAVTPYSREAKIQLGIPKQLMDTFGEYSLPVAQAMASLSQKKEGTDIGIGVVGNLEANGPVFAAYTLGSGKNFEDVFHLTAKDRRSMNNEITGRVLTTAAALLQGQKPRFEIPIIGEAQPLFTEAYYAVSRQAEDVIGVCQMLGLTVGTMESCSGLSLADKLTNVPGGNVFQAGFLAYDENVKQQLGVPFDLIASRGVYNSEIAARMAECLVERIGVDVAFATTGVLDVWDTRPLHQNIPPGTVSIAIAQKGLPTWSETKRFKVETRDAMKLAVASSVFGTFLERSIVAGTAPNQQRILARA